MKKIGILFLIMMVPTSAAFAQKKDRTDAFMYNKQEQYYQAAQSIEKCVNHPNFYNLSNRDQAVAWLYRATIYANIAAVDNDASTCQAALAIAAESIQKLKQTDSGLANENRDYVQSMEEYLTSVFPSNTAQTDANNYFESQGQASPWEIYNQISMCKRIDLDFSDDDYVFLSSTYSSNPTDFWNASRYYPENLSFTIYGDYSVSMYYRTKMFSQRDQNRGNGRCPELEITGTGMLVWEREKMIIKLSVIQTVSGGDYSFINYQNKDMPREIHTYDNYSSTSTYEYEVQFGEAYNSTCIQLNGRDISSTVRGTRSFLGDSRSNGWFFHTKIKIANKPIKINIEEKSQSELNAENSDIYGKWQWNNDRSVIYLESTTKDARLVMWNNNGNLSWGFQLPNTAVGYKTETADSGQELAYLMLSFDGSSEQSFSFVKTGNDFVYAQYDRFMGTLKRDASVLSQIKDKRIMIVNYKQNGSSKTAMFQLEGLEAIYNAITQ